MERSTGAGVDGDEHLYEPMRIEALEFESAGHGFRRRDATFDLVWNDRGVAGVRLRGNLHESSLIAPIEHRKLFDDIVGALSVKLTRLKAHTTSVILLISTDEPTVIMEPFVPPTVDVAVDTHGTDCRFCGIQISKITFRGVGLAFTVVSPTDNTSIFPKSTGKALTGHDLLIGSPLMIDHFSA